MPPTRAHPQGLAALRPLPSAQQHVLMTTLQILGISYTHQREAESHPCFHLGCGWLGCADRKMNGKVRSILCGKIFALHKAPVLSKVFIPCDNLSGTVKRT